MDDARLAMNLRYAERIITLLILFFLLLFLLWPGLPILERLNMMRPARLLDGALAAVLGLDLILLRVHQLKKSRGGC